MEQEVDIRLLIISTLCAVIALLIPLTVPYTPPSLSSMYSSFGEVPTYTWSSPKPLHIQADESRHSHTASPTSIPSNTLTTQGSSSSSRSVLPEVKMKIVRYVILNDAPYAAIELCSSRPLHVSIYVDGLPTKSMHLDGCRTILIQLASPCRSSRHRVVEVYTEGVEVASLSIPSPRIEILNVTRIGSDIRIELYASPPVVLQEIDVVYPNGTTKIYTYLCSYVSGREVIDVRGAVNASAIALVFERLKPIEIELS